MMNEKWPLFLQLIMYNKSSHATINHKEDDINANVINF